MTNDKNAPDEGKDFQEDGWLPMEGGGIICDEHGDAVCIVINPRPYETQEDIKTLKPVQLSLFDSVDEIAVGSDVTPCMPCIQEAVSETSNSKENASNKKKETSDE